MAETLLFVETTKPTRVPPMELLLRATSYSSFSLSLLAFFGIIKTNQLQNHGVCLCCPLLQRKNENDIQTIGCGSPVHET
jgi:hypothetical protein